MGRITIFSIEECAFCRRTKAALSSRSIPYANINIESYPKKRSDMIALTDKTSVPQVFFNDKHVGGSVETFDILSKWDEESGNDASCEDQTPYDRYIRTIESEPDPTDERLSVPTEPPPTTQKMDFASPRTSETLEVNGKTYTSLELTKLLVQRMPRDSLSYRVTLYYDVFKGSSGVDALKDIFQLESREKAVQLGLELQQKKYLCHVTNDHIFGDSGYYFRLQLFQTPNVLNSFRIWSDTVEDQPMYVIHRLGKLWGKLESKHLDENGMVDHSTLRTDEFYWKFEEEVCELQKISLRAMNDKTRLAFVINVYNLMIKYAFVKVGIASSKTRTSFFSDVSMNVGGDIFSFDDLEHGILRGNTRHPYQLSKRFGSTDSRKELARKELDPRIHFALNCGARSCPPVKKYTAEEIDEELRLAAMSFCEQESNVDIGQGNLKLSKLLHWYQSDFGKYFLFYILSLIATDAQT
ncbi:hypothetical protein ACHAWF_016147 [Thalassiosira exigua]